MAMGEQERRANKKDAERLQELTEALYTLTQEWMGLGIQRQRLEAIKMEQAAIRTRMADRLRLAFYQEKNSDGEAVAAAPDHAHDQADGKFSDAARGWNASTGMEAHYKPIVQGVDYAKPDKCDHSAVYFNSITGVTTCAGCGVTGTRNYYRPGFRFSPQDRVFLKSLRITLDDPAESGSM